MHTCTHAHACTCSCTCMYRWRSSQKQGALPGSHTGKSWSYLGGARKAVLVISYPSVTGRGQEGPSRMGRWSQATGVSTAFRGYRPSWPWGPKGHWALQQEAQIRPAWLETADLVLLEPVAELWPPEGRRANIGLSGWGWLRVERQRQPGEVLMQPGLKTLTCHALCPHSQDLSHQTHCPSTSSSKWQDLTFSPALSNRTF